MNYIAKLSFEIYGVKVIKQFKVRDHKINLFHDKSDLKLILNDKFDGNDLDLTKCDFRLHIMGKYYRHSTDNAYYLDDNSNIVFTIVNKNGYYCTT